MVASGGQESLAVEIRADQRHGREMLAADLGGGYPASRTSPVPQTTRSTMSRPGAPSSGTRRTGAPPTAPSRPTEIGTQVPPEECRQTPLGGQGRGRGDFGPGGLSPGRCDCGPQQGGGGHGRLCAALMALRERMGHGLTDALVRDPVVCDCEREQCMNTTELTFASPCSHATCTTTSTTCHTLDTTTQDI